MSDAVVGVVLAAGAGTRYGSPKVLAHDGLWLRTAVQALTDGGCDQVIVVLGAVDVTVPDGATAVHAPHWEQGMSASFTAGLEAASDAAYAPTPKRQPRSPQARLAHGRAHGRSVQAPKQAR